ncbi:CFEM domain-containing protein [Fusarium sp. Ph1]|nr:CFEM domain-containing protein [Fusarium sp. Ph1]
MRTLSLVLFSLSGILVLENGSDNGDVGTAQMPDCAVNCIKEHVPNSGCDLPHSTCLCDLDFRTKHGPAIAPCLIVLCDANEINKVQNAWRGQCEEAPSRPEGKESVKSEVKEETSTAILVVSAPSAIATGDVAVQSSRTEVPNILARVLVEKALILTTMISMQKLAPRLTPLRSTPRRTPIPTTSSSTSSETSSSTSSSTPKQTPTPTPKSWTGSTSSSESETESTSSTTSSTSTGTQKSTPTATPARTPVPNSNQSGQGLTVGAKAGIGVGVSFGVVGMACFAATLWRRTREKAPPVTPTQEIQDVGKGGLSATTAQHLQASEIDGRDAPRELPA